MSALIVGQTYVVSFNSAAYANILLTSVKPYRDNNNTKRMKGEAGQTVGHIGMDPTTKIAISGNCTSAPSLVDKLATLTFTPPGGVSTKYRCESYKPSYVEDVTVLDIDMEKEDSMSYP